MRGDAVVVGRSGGAHIPPLCEIRALRPYSASSPRTASESGLTSAHPSSSCGAGMWWWWVGGWLGRGVFGRSQQPPEAASIGAPSMEEYGPRPRGRRRVIDGHCARRRRRRRRHHGPLYCEELSRAPCPSIRGRAVCGTMDRPVESRRRTCCPAPQAAKAAAAPSPRPRRPCSAVQRRALLCRSNPAEPV